MEDTLTTVSSRVLLPSPASHYCRSSTCTSVTLLEGLPGSPGACPSLCSLFCISFGCVFKCICLSSALYPYEAFLSGWNTDCFFVLRLFSLNGNFSIGRCLCVCVCVLFPSLKMLLHYLLSCVVCDKESVLFLCLYRHASVTLQGWFQATTMKQVLQ